eukprot:800623-Pyramimonas_sp.AAC.1
MQQDSGPGAQSRFDFYEKGDMSKREVAERLALTLKLPRMHESSSKPGPHLLCRTISTTSSDISRYHILDSMRYRSWWQSSCCAISVVQAWKMIDACVSSVDAGVRVCTSVHPSTRTAYHEHLLASRAPELENTSRVHRQLFWRESGGSLEGVWRGSGGDLEGVWRGSE